MKLEILSFSGKLFKSRNVVSVNCMSKIWEITVLDNHESLITALSPCVINVVYIDEDNTKKEVNFAVWSGVLEFSHNSMKILIDLLVSVDDLDVDSVEKARQEALKTMDKYKNSQDKVDMEKYVEAQDLLLKSLAQLKLWKIR